MAHTRRASHAGTWYTANPSQLDAQLSQWLSAVPSEESFSQPTRAVISPHAGLSYSGPTAAHAFSHVSDATKRVFILGPSHHVYLRGCALTRTQLYATPLGDLTVDQQVNEELKETGLFTTMDLDTDEDEHSIEMQLPYIAKVLQGRDITVVPILVGNLSNDKETTYGKALAPYLADPGNFFVISSDFCHWGERFGYQPYDESKGEIHESIESLDRQGMSLIEARDTKGFAAYLKAHGNTICGRHPIAVLLNAMDALEDISHQVAFTHYSQSSPCKSMRDSSVSYAAAVVTKPGEL